MYVLGMRRVPFWAFVCALHLLFVCAVCAGGLPVDTSRVNLPLDAYTTVDQVLSQCPTAAEIAAVDADLTITFEGDPTSGTLVCTSESGSEDLTRLQERAYQAVLMMKRISFTMPLPWTSQDLYTWFVNSIRGIRFRDDIEYSFCCDPAAVINIQTGNLAALQTNRWMEPRMGTGLDGLMLLFIHEARHNEIGGHSCGTHDNTIDELGAWGVQYHLRELLAYYSDPCFFEADDPWPTYYLELSRGDADYLHTHVFCEESTTPVDPPVPAPLCESVTADFSASPTSGPAPLTVSFTDLSSDKSETFSWDFGDSSSSDFPNPVHMYTNPGTYTVSLTVTYASASDVETKVAYITVSEPPILVPANGIWKSPGGTFSMFLQKYQAASCVLITLTNGVLTAFLDSNYEDGIGQNQDVFSQNYSVEMQPVDSSNASITANLPGMQGTFTVSLIFPDAESALETVPLNGIWRSADDTVKFFLQKYQTGSSVVVVLAGGGLTAFLDSQFSDGIQSSSDVMGNSASMSLGATGPSDGVITIQVPGVTQTSTVSLAFPDTP